MAKSNIKPSSREEEFLKIKGLLTQIAQAAYDNHFSKIWDESDKQATAQKEMSSILLVEDEPTHAFLFTKIIENLRLKLNLPEANIHHCQTGQLAEAVAKCENERDNLELIILDLTLSDMSGIELLPKFPQDIPVIIISASSEAYMAEKVNGFNNVLKCIKKGQKLEADDWRDIERIIEVSSNSLINGLNKV